MKKFKHHQTVVITDTAHPLHNRTGRVTRLLSHDNGAWVAMSDEIPDEHRLFAAPDPRRNSIVLYPEQCEVVK